MALRNNRFNAQGHNGGIFAGSAEAWAVKRMHLRLNMYAGEGGIDDTSGIPNGYNMGGASLQPLKAGGMSSYNPAILNLVSDNADAKMGKALEGSATLSIVNTNAQADQIVPMIADAALVIAKDNAAMSAGVQAAADSTMTITPSASLGGIIPATATAACAITPNLDMTALAFMIAEAGGPTELSPQGLANAVWDTVLADHVDAGTTGAALNDAGGAGNPWSADLSSNNTPGTFGNFVQKLLSVAKFLGLK
jgi:hypothetical protein